MRFQIRRREDPDLNMTSLIDVVLLLLIFFMMSTKFLSTFLSLPANSSKQMQSQ